MAKENYKTIVVASVIFLWMQLTSFRGSNRGESAVSPSSESTVHQPPGDPYYPACHANPYHNALTTSLENVSAQIHHWLDHERTLFGARALDPKYRSHTHSRFFPFVPMAPCKEEHLECVGGKCGTDLAKTLCGLQEHLETRRTTDSDSAIPCVIYSIGGNNLWGFELDLLKRTPCEIHTFDCTGERERFQVPENTTRIHFHHVCLTAYSKNGKYEPDGNMIGESWTLLEMQQKLGHSRIDVLKVDIEGWEWPLFHSWPELDHIRQSEQMLLPMQIAVEVRVKVFQRFQNIAGPPEGSCSW